ncbi:MAG: hypothetical protein JSS86_25210 [Cyanobacteria bacterium SZAS LIN-2]|nr:hypothetical protein [Cyanobacteria bacterium SZAS LIN-2]
MNIRVHLQKSALVSLMVGVLISLSVPVLASRPSIPSPAKQALEQGMKENWHSSQAIDKGYVSIECDVADDGKIYNPVITRFSGNDQYDAECFEALCGLSPLRNGPNEINLSSDHVMETFGITIPESITPKLSAADIKAYLEGHPAQSTKVVVHKIPLFMLSRYPTMLKAEDISNPKNLIEIDFKPDSIDSAGRRLSQPDYVYAIRCINGWWTKRLCDSGPITRESILQHAEGVSPRLWQ